MKERKGFVDDHNKPKKPDVVPNKYKIALQAQAIEDSYNAESAEAIAQDMYAEMLVYFRDYDLSIKYEKIGGKTIPVIDAGSFTIARTDHDEYTYTDNQGQNAQEASISRIVEMMGDNPDIKQELLENQMVDDAEMMAKIVLLFEVPEQIELLPPTDMYRHNDEYEDDDSQDSEVIYIDRQGKEYKMAGPLLDYKHSTKDTPSSELSLKTIMVPGKGIIMYNVSKKYFEITTFDHKTVRATSIEDLKTQFNKL